MAQPLLLADVSRPAAAEYKTSTISAPPVLWDGVGIASTPPCTCIFF